jgi:hypothetical protein
MMQSETKTIGSTEYEVTQLPSGRGRKLLLRLVRIVGPAVGELLKGGEAGTATLASVSAEGLSAAVGELAARLGEDDFEYAVKELASSTKVRVDGGGLVPLASVLDLHFAGAYGEMLSWLAFALEVNFRSFFSGLGSLVAPTLGAKAKSQSPSPQA